MQLSLAVRITWELISTDFTSTHHSTPTLHCETQPVLLHTQHPILPLEVYQEFVAQCDETQLIISCMKMTSSSQGIQLELFNVIWIRNSHFPVSTARLDSLAQLSLLVISLSRRSMQLKVRPFFKGNYDPKTLRSIGNQIQKCTSQRAESAPPPTVRKCAKTAFLGKNQPYEGQTVDFLSAAPSPFHPPQILPSRVLMTKSGYCIVWDLNIVLVQNIVD